jgi:hypothetical protein
MRNFEYNEDENDVDKFWQGEEEDDDMEEEEYDAKQMELIHAMEMQLAERDLDLRALKIVIKMLEKSFCWRFYKFQTKLKMITKSYFVLIKMLEKNREIQDDA